MLGIHASIQISHIILCLLKRTKQNSCCHISVAQGRQLTAQPLLPVNIYQGIFWADLVSGHG